MSFYPRNFPPSPDLVHRVERRRPLIVLPLSYTCLFKETLGRGRAGLGGGPLETHLGQVSHLENFGTTCVSLKSI